MFAYILKYDDVVMFLPSREVTHWHKDTLLREKKAKQVLIFKTELMEVFEA